MMKNQWDAGTQGLGVGEMLKVEYQDECLVSR
jgi:hypothetical protein